MKRPSRLLLCLGLLASAACAAPLELLPGPGGRYDLPVEGIQGPGRVMHLSRADLMGLPHGTVDVSGGFGTRVRSARVVFLADLLDALALPPGSDLLLARCSDGYLSVYTFEFIRRYRPFLVLELDGLGPDRWPPPGLAYNPGPNLIGVSDHVVPGVSALRDIGHKGPWGVVSLTVTSMKQSFGGFFQGPWANLGEPARQGRQIWINSCASCHPGPAGVTGGTKSGVPFTLPQGIAAADMKFFRQYVRNPTSLIPGAKMEPHPHYSDTELDQLAAFLGARGP